MEAEELLKTRAEKPVQLRACFSNDPTIRRDMLKNIFFRLPARPLIKFVYYLFVRGGVLDGRAGFIYSSLQAIYEYMISLKVMEIKRKQQKLPL